MPWISAIINVYKVLHMQHQTENRLWGKSREQEKSWEPEKWGLTNIIVCYSDECATDITDILNKTISEEVS